MSHQVYILWFKNSDPASQNDYHWSFFVIPINSSHGVKYDTVSSTNNLGILEWYYSHLPHYEMQQSSSFGGRIMLGYINDVEGFKTSMLATPLPGAGENCQSWIKRAVQEAVNRGLLPASAKAQVG